MSTSDDAVAEVKKRKKEIVAAFADPQIFLPADRPFTIFMAGSAGAGKTEFSNKFDFSITDYSIQVPIVRIDADEIRKLLPQFSGDNADEVQTATTIGVEKLFDHIQNYDQNAIVDTTFSDLDKAINNVRRSLKRNRKVGIFYIHLNPIVAWTYTQARQTAMGRKVTKDFFIESYIKAKENVDIVKQTYPEIELNLIDKELTDDMDTPIKANIKFNIDRVANHIKLVYNRDELVRIIKS